VKIAMLRSGSIATEKWWPIDSEHFSGSFMLCIKGVTSSQFVQSHKSVMCLRGKFSDSVEASKFHVRFSPKQMNTGYKIFAKLLLSVMSRKYTELSDYDLDNGPPVSLPVLKYADRVYMSREVSDIGLILDNFPQNRKCKEVIESTVFSPNVVYSFSFFQNFLNFDTFCLNIAGLSIDLTSTIGSSLPVEFLYEDKVIWGDEIVCGSSTV